MKDPDNNKTKWNDRALNYDKSYKSKFFTTIQSKVIDITGLKPNMTFLDLGCGTGWAVNYAFEKTGGRGTFIGIDISENMIAIAGEKFKDIAAIRFIQSSAENISLSPGSVDRMICTNSFHHYGDPMGVLTNIKKILKTNGLLCLADVTTDSFFAKFLNVLLKKTEKEHVSFYSTKKYKEMFENAGLKFKTTQAINPIIKIHICEKV